MNEMRASALGAAVLALAAYGCTQAAPAPQAPEQPIRVSPAAFNSTAHQTVMLAAGSVRWVVNAPTQLAETLSGNKPYDAWAACAKAALGPALNPAAPRPVTLLTDAATKNAMLMAVIPDASLVVMIKGFSDTDSQATIYTTASHANNPANVKTATAELQKCAST
jgi:hypothetical protein